MVLSHVVFPVPAVWWTQSRWYDVYHDTGTPSRVLIAGQWACVEYDLGVVEPRAGRAYKCATRWRSGPHAK